MAPKHNRVKRSTTSGHLAPASAAVRTTKKERLPLRANERSTGIVGQKKKLSSHMSADQVREGLPMSALDELAKRLNVDREAFAQILGTSVRTLQRKRGERARLGPVASDRLARVTRILNLAAHVFGELDKASIWLTSKSRALDGEVPLRMLDTDIGAERVQQELRQIEFGMPL